MPVSLKLCKGTNKQGLPCRNRAKEGSEYCYWHQQSEEVQNKIEAFVNEHKEALIAFIAGAVGQEVIGDIYHAIRDQITQSLWGTWSSIEPIATESELPQELSQHDLSNRFMKEHDYSTLLLLLKHLKFLLTPQQVQKILGPPSRLSVEAEPGYEWEPPRYLYYDYFIDLPRQFRHVNANSLQPGQRAMLELVFLVNRPAPSRLRAIHFTTPKNGDIFETKL